MKSYIIRQYENISFAILFTGYGMIFLAVICSLIYKLIIKGTSSLIYFLFIGVILAGITSLLSLKVWCVIVDHDSIIFTNTIGIKKQFKFEDIAYCLLEKEGEYTNLIVYSSKGKLVKIEGHCGKGLTYFIEDCKKRRIPFKDTKKG